MSEVYVIKVAVLVTADTRPKDLSRWLDGAFEDVDEVLQFVVEGYGWDEGQEPTEEWLMAGVIEGALDAAVAAEGGGR